MSKLIIISTFILSCFVLLFFKIKKYYKMKKQNNANEFFVHDRIRFIEDYFEYDTYLKLTTNTYRGKIVGFFLEVRKDSSAYPIIQYRKCPSISHEMSIDEFCHFIEEYIKPPTDKQHMVCQLMEKHRDLLEWE